MAYTPAQRRQNLIYAECHRWVREAHPRMYAEFVQAAREAVPIEDAGRHARPAPVPSEMVKVPVKKFTKPIKTLRPMRGLRKQREEADCQPMSSLTK